MRKVGVVAVWFCLGLGITELVALAMEQVVVTARVAHQMTAYASPNPLLTRTDLVAQMPHRP